MRSIYLYCRMPLNLTKAIASRKRDKRLLMILFVAVLGLVAGPLNPVLAQRAGNGYLMVTVYNLEAAASAKPVTVVAKRQSGYWGEYRTAHNKDLRRVSSEGEVFKTELPVGVYTVYIEGAREDVTKLVKHRIEPGATTMVSLEGNPPQVYCTADGERIRPTGLGVLNTKDLRPLKNEVIDLPGTAKLNVVIEYCQKTPKGEYKSARVISDATSFFGDNLAFNKVTGKLFASYTTVTAVQHDQRASREVGAQELIATFNDGVPHISFGPFSVEGNGALDKKGSANFNFNVSGSSFAFTYVDQAAGLKLVSDNDDCSFLLPLSDQAAKFSGSATVTGNSSRLKGRPTSSTVNFEVRIADAGEGKGRDSFSIEIPDLHYRKVVQGLTSGNIQIMKDTNTSSPDGLSGVLKRKP